jgi:hypothetical protein
MRACGAPGHSVVPAFLLGDILAPIAYQLIAHELIGAG